MAQYTMMTLILVSGLLALGPSGAARADDLTPTGSPSDLWVDGAGGSDANGGLTPSTAYRTIQKAADEAGPGSVIHILPGVYRETVRPGADGAVDAPIVYVAEEGPGTVVVRGSEPSSSLSWERLTDDPIGLPGGVDPENIYYADLRPWHLVAPPRFVVEMDGEGEVAARLPLAREPDWHVAKDWRYHELWWTADGGSGVAECDPSEDDWNCDLPSRSENQLTDRNAFPEPDSRIEAGSLATLDNLVGARLVAMDAKWGHYVYDRRISSHNQQAGRITLEGQCLQDGGTSDPGLGWGTKFYVEDHPALLDSPGEWWYDAGTGRLYLWSPTGADPARLSIEISRRDRGFDLTDRSHITLDGLTVELLNQEAVRQGWGGGVEGNTIRNATLRYANFGVAVRHSGSGVTRDFTLEESEIAHIDTNGLFISEWWDGAPTPTIRWQPSTENIVVRGNEFHHLGFRTDTDNAMGIKIQFANRLRFEDNHVHDIAHNGVQFLWSVVNSDKTYDFAPSEIKTGEILVKDNLFEDVCQLTTDCGALKFWGQPPDNHVFRDVLVTGNVFRDNAAWTYVGEQRGGWWIGGESCEVEGQAGFGLYLDYASGLHAYRNVAYNNAYAGFMLTGTWRDGDVVLYNNVAANSLYGLRLAGGQQDTHSGSVNTQIVNNDIVGNEGYGVYQTASGEGWGNTRIDHNLYYNNGWRSWNEGGVWKAGDMRIDLPGRQAYYQTVIDIQQDLPPWEARGAQGMPMFQRYDPDDHDPYDGSWPDFHVSGACPLSADRGADRIASLVALLERFGVDDPKAGEAYDIGSYEAGFRLLASPSVQAVDPCGAARYEVTLDPDSLTYPVDLAVVPPDPGIAASLDVSSLTGNGVATLTVSDVECADASSTGELHTVSVSGTAGDVGYETGVGLLVGGSQVFLPLTMRLLD